MAKKNDGSFVSFLAGALAGSVDTCITMPLDTIKTQLQINPKPGFFGCASKIVKADGARGFYYGFQPFVVQASGKAAVRFYAYGVISSVLSKTGLSKKAHPTAFSVIGGMGAGTCEAVMWTCPTERIKILRQATAGTGGKNVVSFASVIESQGILGLYRGVSPTVIRQASSVAVRFTLFEKVTSALHRLFKSKNGEIKTSTMALITFMSGGIGGAVSVVVNNPADVIKSKIQSCTKPQTQGMVEVAKEVLRENGIRGFYAGLSARIPRLFLSQAIQFTVVDQILRLSQP